MNIPRGVADIERDLGYIAGSQGLIECLDLATGRLVARANFRVTPLAIDRGTVIGWAPTADRPNTIHVFALVRDGSILATKWKTPLELPAWADVASLEPNDFQIAVNVRDETLLLTWAAQSHYRGGAPPPPSVAEADTNDERREIHLDPETGAVVGEAPAALPQSEEDSLPELPPDRRIVPYLSQESWLTKAWRVGVGDAFLSRSAGEPGIILTRRGPGSAAISTEFRLTDVDAEAAVSPDGGLIFIQIPGPGGIEWRVFNAETGDRVSTLPFDAGTEGVAVVNDKALYMVTEYTEAVRRRSIRCRNLQTGKALWARALGDEHISEPPPPPP